MINGRDWASYQGAEPDVSGIDFAFVKVTQGLTYINPYWQQQFHHAQQAGLVTGLYHYPDMRNGAGIEAERFCTVAANALSSGPVMACLDWEGYDADNQTVSHGDQAAYKDAFLTHLEVLRPNNRAVLYCDLDYWRHVDTSGHFGDGLWISAPGTPPGQPGIQTPWTFHQYAIEGGVDQDVANFPTRAALRAWAADKEDPMPYTPEQIVAMVQQGTTASLRDPANRSLLVADNLWWWQHAIDGTVPVGSSPSVEASIRAIHAAYVVLQQEAEPTGSKTAPAAA